MILLEEPYLTLGWDEKLECITAKWKGVGSDGRVKEMLDKALALAQERRAHKWLADATTIGPFGKDIQGWINEVWWPHAAQAGLQYMAFVIPASAMARLAMNTVVPAAPDAIQTANFDNIEAAKAWLRIQPVRK